ncbi:MAG: hypothetical protein ACT4OW_02535 [Nitrososphaerota archaeon]
MSPSDFVIIFSNPAITAIIGAIAGAFVSFLPLYSIQLHNDNQFKKNIKQLVKIALDSYNNFLNELLTNGKDTNDVLFIEFGDKLIPKIKSIMPNGNFKPINYRNLDGETKAKAFTKTLAKLEEVYRNIEYFHGFEITTITGSGFQFATSKTRELVQEIKSLIEMISKRSWFEIDLLDRKG